MNPKFTIIIPVYNVAPYLRECLDSVIVAAENLSCVERGEQVEVICVDDGSTDGSGVILDEYASRFPSTSNFNFTIRVIHQKNTGVSIARNVALDAARGEWIAACDPDDEVKPEWLLHLDEAIRANPEVKFFWTDITCIENGVTSIRDEAYDKDAVGLIGEMIRGSFWGGMVNKIYHRETLNAHGVRCPNSRVHSREDVVLCCGYLATKPLVRHIPHADYIYKIRRGSLIHHGALPKLEQELVIEDHLERVLNKVGELNIIVESRLRLKYRFYDSNEVDDEVFKRLYPEITGCARLKVPLHHNVMFWLSTHGGRSLVRAFLRKVRGK